MDAYRILWVIPYFPWPVRNGGMARQDALLRALSARGHRITVLSLTHEAPSEAVLEGVREFLDRVEIAPRRKLAHPISLSKALLSRRPAITSINAASLLFRIKFENLIQQDFHIVQIEHSYALGALRTPLRRHRLPFILTEHNVESRVAQVPYSRFPAPLRAFGLVDRLRYQFWEKTAVREASCVVAVSQDEEKFFQTLGARTAVVPNCIDTSAHREVLPDRNADRVLFIGNYRYPPNVSAVEWLCDDIMPRLWQQKPEVKLSVCGFELPEQWRKRWLDPRVSFSGFVSRVTDAHSESSVFVAPLRAGAGSKLKVIEAMASGLPVVATQQGVSGLNVEDGVHYRHGETPDEITQALASLLRDRQRAERMGETARNFAVQNHDWSIAAAALERVYAAQRAQVA